MPELFVPSHFASKMVPEAIRGSRLTSRLQRSNTSICQMPVSVRVSVGAETSIVKLAAAGAKRVMAFPFSFNAYVATTGAVESTTTRHDQVARPAVGVPTLPAASTMSTR
ncbi:MAG: hypothetical protein BWY66_00262 [bacterium ADurb.Bin374]|nr:MAG: hypothetical protein BWY66_00262 [bacterium ADurb.Bin374]